ncbi:M20 family dipeptidase [Streptomyces sp. RPA4-5]|uniref:M20/M25/M40 family metallo-hydrolase n=1 Tax=Streptomyces TaxID=1883 RepID=UPI00143E7DD8|nr:MULTISPECIES: M20/M25/M40 family metallo-hydrolase [Streptomyces]MCX4634143.1 M20/M25/M40 family metallo-hydrolase [Streptomyces platensis]QIY55321.1 M20 family dipeptidase [Streptomyces sp. RPA4-5]WJY38034.1 M20/M25/M40 family metallo-hydrolase [Streptomyces sp. P9-2B-2]
MTDASTIRAQLPATPRELVQDRQDELIAGLMEYVSQPSVSATGEGFPAATDVAVEEVKRAGLTPSVLVGKGRPLVVGHRAGPEGAPHVLLYGHYDVQPAGPREKWDSEPFTPVLRDGRIWGRGTGDNKGQHYAHLQALRLFDEHLGALPCTVTVLLDGEEEIGSPTLADTLRAHKELFDCDLVVWSDRSVHESGEWCVSHGVRGMLQLRIGATGASRPLHSGNFGNVAPNPAWQLVQALASLKDTSGRVLVEGFDDGREPLSDADRAAFAALPLDLQEVLGEIGLTEMDPAFNGLSFYERLADRPTLTINGITTGDVDRTIIPDTAEAGVDIRLTAGQDPQTVFERVAAHLRAHAPEVTVTMAGGVPASRTSIDNPHTPRVARAISRVTGRDPLLIPAYGGTLPDWIFTGILGVPSIGLPLANADQANHAPNENLRVDYFLDATAICMELLLELGA